jgi:hypothetical protein
MLKKSVSYGLLLFSWSMILLAYKPADSGIANLVYWIMGGIGGVLSLFLVISAFWEKWSKRVEDFIEKQLDLLLFVILWSVFIVGYLQAIGSLVSSSQSNWLVESTFYAGFVLFLLIPAHYFKELYAHQKQRRKSQISS